MPQFTFSCPHCSQPVQAEEEWIGQQAECPFCKQTITINHVQQSAIHKESKLVFFKRQKKWIILSAVLVSGLIAVGAGIYIHTAGIPESRTGRRVKTVSVSIEVQSFFDRLPLSESDIKTMFDGTATSRTKLDFYTGFGEVSLSTQRAVIRYAEDTNADKQLIYDLKSSYDIHQTLKSVR